MRVLLLGPYPPPHGGVQTNLVAIRALLLERGMPCAVINLHRFRSGEGEQVYHPKTALGVLALLLRLRYDIVHLHIGGAVPGRLLLLSLLCCLMPRSKAVLTFHSGGYATAAEGKAAIPRSLRGLVFRRFDRVIAVNREIVELFRRFGVPAGRIRLIPPHPSPGRGSEAPLPARLREFFDSHNPVLLTVGLLEPEYDLGLQITALGRVREKYPQAGLALIGAGSLEQELLAHIRQQPYAEHILLCGDMPHPATLRAIREADLFLRTTCYDGDSVAVREALHLGTRVIASDNKMRPGGVRLIPAADLGALCAAIEEQLASAGAGKQAEAEPGTDNIQAVLDLYRELGM